jgi:diaminohydroxyphosphoribosylaminopyrimidine deaminase/5-amino-6-(5-phosphoribosylamino)uracil reductase
LQAAGIIVEEGLCRDAAETLNAGFLKRVRMGLPFVTVKIAASLDGRIALPSGESRWITNTQARQFGHYLRAMHDAIMVGTETVLRDNPVLSCRLPGLADRSPVRVVLDRRRRLPETMNIFKTDVQETWLFTTAGHTVPFGTKLMPVQEAGGRLCVHNMLKTLASEGITRLLVEGGSRLATTLLDNGLADTIWWFQAPKILGGQARAALDTNAPDVVPADVSILDTRHWGSNYGLLMQANFVAQEEK